MKIFFRRMYLLVAVIITSVALVQPIAVLAADDPSSLQNICQVQPDAAACNPGRNTELYGPNGVLTRGASIMAWIAGVIAVVMIMVAGFKYIIASGDSNNVSSAKNTLMYALIGLAIAATAQGIVIFVLNRL